MISHMCNEMTDKLSSSRKGNIKWSGSVVLYQYHYCLRLINSKSCQYVFLLLVFYSYFIVFLSWRSLWNFKKMRKTEKWSSLIFDEVHIIECASLEFSIELPLFYFYGFSDCYVNIIWFHTNRTDFLYGISFYNITENIYKSKYLRLFEKTFSKE